MAWYRFTVRTSKVGSDCSDDIEIPDEELEGLDEKAKTKLLDEYLSDFVGNTCDQWYEEIDGEDEEAQ